MGLLVRDDLHGPDFGRTRQRPGGEAGAERVVSTEIAPELAHHVRDDVHDVGVALYLHELRNLDGAGLADTTDVVTPKVDQHDVLGPLLLIAQQFLRQGVVLLLGLATRTRARDGMRRRCAVLYAHQQLRRRTDDMEVVDVEEVHVGRWIEGPQGTVDVEGSSRGLAAQPLGEDDLDALARRDQLARLFHLGHEGLFGVVGG